MDPKAMMGRGGQMNMRQIAQMFDPRMIQKMGGQSVRFRSLCSRVFCLFSVALCRCALVAWNGSPSAVWKLEITACFRASCLASSFRPLRLRGRCAGMGNLQNMIKKFGQGMPGMPGGMPGMPGMDGMMDDM